MRWCWHPSHVTGSRDFTHLVVPMLLAIQLENYAAFVDHHSVSVQCSLNSPISIFASLFVITASRVADGCITTLQLLSVIMHDCGMKRNARLINLFSNPVNVVDVLDNVDRDMRYVCSYLFAPFTGYSWLPGTLKNIMSSLFITGD